MTPSPSINLQHQQRPTPTAPTFTATQPLQGQHQYLLQLLYTNFTATNDALATITHGDPYSPLLTWQRQKTHRRRLPVCFALTNPFAAAASNPPECAKPPVGKPESQSCHSYRTIRYTSKEYGDNREACFELFATSAAHRKDGQRE